MARGLRTGWLWLWLCGALGWSLSQTLAAQAPAAPRPLPLSAEALRQLQVLGAEKRARTPAQRKLDSHLLYASLHARHDARLRAVPELRILPLGSDGRLPVTIRLRAATAIKPVIAALHAVDALIQALHPSQATLRARLAPEALEAIAARDDVRFIEPVRPPLVTHVDSEGDVTHRAEAARGLYGTIGAGVKLCAISDGVDSLAFLQGQGDLPAVDVLPGQAGSGDEGTAMLEILHDLAPGAALGFATANPDEAALATNIAGLASAHCDVIVDDVAYLSESPFQDTLIAQAVNTVTGAGALYFSSAGNEGSFDAGTSGTWEGDFKGNGTLAVLGAGAGVTNDFGDGGQSDPITAGGQAVDLHWSDPAGASCNDYDLYVLDSTLTNVVELSNNIQSCTQDPLEITGPTSAGEHLVVTQASGANRLLNVRNVGGQLELATPGTTRGHNSAGAAFNVAAAPAAAGIAAPGYPSGPFPGPFTSAQLPEPYSSDGPRRVFFDHSGNLLPGAPAGNFSSTGGVVRQKPDLTAADGVSTDVTLFARFFGTSAAAPHAAAIAALLKSALPGITPAAVRSALIASAIDVLQPGWDRDTGAGIVMADRALAAGGAPLEATLALGSIVPSELGGNGDATIDPGEEWSLSILLQNQGGAAATAVAASLASTTPGVTVLQGLSPYPDLAVGGGAANQQPFVFLTPNLDCGADLEFSLTVNFAGGKGPAVLTFSLPSGHPGTPVTFSYSGPVIAIPDGGNPPGALNEADGIPAIATLAVSGLGRIKAIAFRFDGATCSTAAGASTVGVDHTFINDLTFDLTSPAGTIRRILSRIDVDGHNLCQTVLEDGGGLPTIEGAHSSQAPFTGTWQGNAPFADFAGEDPNGAWTLTAIDHFGQNTGSLRAFSVIVTPAVCSSVAIASIPTLSPGAAGILALLLLGAGSVILRARRRRRCA